MPKNTNENEIRRATVYVLNNCTSSYITSLNKQLNEGILHALPGLSREESLAEVEKGIKQRGLVHTW